MRISILAENTALNDSFEAEHGLSVYVEDPKVRLLIDTGASPLFLRNAQRLGVQVEDVDYLVLTHGHTDHTGGLTAFLSKNLKAQAYMVTEAYTEGHYSLKPNGIRDISLKFLGEESRISLMDIGKEGVRLTDNILIFKTLEHPYALPRCNGNLYAGPRNVIRNEDGFYEFGAQSAKELNKPQHEALRLGLKPDNFRHECNVLYTLSDGKVVLFAGCAHNGILNIMEACKALLGGKYPDYCLGGMHLSGNSMQNTEDEASVRTLAKGLKATGTTFFTGHCTGTQSISILREVLGEQVMPISSGLVLDL